MFHFVSGNKHYRPSLVLSTLRVFPEHTFPKGHNPDHVIIPNVIIPKSPRLWTIWDTPFGSNRTCENGRFDQSGNQRLGL